MTISLFQLFIIIWAILALLSMIGAGKEIGKGLLASFLWGFWVAIVYLIVWGIHFTISHP